MTDRSEEEEDEDNKPMIIEMDKSSSPSIIDHQVYTDHYYCFIFMLID